MKTRSYAIIGAGALGGFYGGLLARHGIETHFLVHSDYEHIRRHGLRVDSSWGSFRLPKVHAWRRPQDLPPCDVVAVALKTTRNGLLPRMLPHMLSKDGVVLILQNGLGVEDEVARIVGAQRVMGGLCFLCSNKVGPGHIRHLDYGRVVLADYDPKGRPMGITRRMKEIGADLAAAGIPVQLSRDLILARWKKLVWNIPYNGLSVALHATTDELMAHPATRELVHTLMKEVVRGAAAEGRKIPRSFVQKMLDDTDRMPSYLTSMRIDYDHHRPMELEAIFGNPLRRARAAGVELPLIDMLHRQLCFLDHRNTRESKSSSRRIAARVRAKS